MKSLKAKVFCKDKKLFYVYCNEGYAQDLKITSDKIAGKTDYDFYLKEKADKYRTEEQKILESGQIEENEEKWVHDGEECYLHTVKFPVKDEKGHIIGLMGILFDITDFKRMQKEEQDFSPSSARLFSSLSSIFIFIDEDNKVEQWNDIAESTFGIAAGDVVGRSFSECGIKWGNIEIDKIVISCRGKSEPVRVNDVPYECPNGEKGYLGITMISDVEYCGTHFGVILIARDITDRKLMESQLTQAQKLESIGQLAAGIAHEINTPTQYIGDNTKFLQDGFGDLCKLIEKYAGLLEACKAGNVSADLIREIEETEKKADLEYLMEEIPRAIEQSLEGVDSVAKIVRAMKEFSHPGTEEKVPIDINKAIESTVTMSKNQWKYVADVVTNFDTSLPLVKCLPSEINQVILNIVVNAAHAIGDVVGKSGDKKGIITISTVQDGNCVVIRIQDTGTGIPELARTKIFDPFFTTKEVGKGTGQGLAISHDIVVKKHGGTITFDTEMGKGTAFNIRLPVDG